MLGVPHNPAPAPPPLGGGGWAPNSPVGLGNAFLGTAIGVTVVTIVMALLAPAYVSSLKTRDPSELTFSGYEVVSFLMLPLLVTSYVLFALWVGRIRAHWRYRNVEPGGPPAVEWWGWFIPVASLVLPYLGVRAINRKVVSGGIVAGWWILYLISGVPAIVNQLAQFQALDWATGELNDPEALNSIPAYEVAGAIFTVLSLAFLVLLVRQLSSHFDKSPGDVVAG